MELLFKVCTKCKKDKALEKFPVAKSRKDGRASWCKECCNNYNKVKTCEKVGCETKIMGKSKTCAPCWEQDNRGAGSPRWVGGRHADKDGYVHISGQQSHPNANKFGSVREHILVMSNYLGRALTRHETVHHMNTDPSDNRIENLQLRIGQHGKGGTYKCSDCGSDRVEPTEI
jgi:hypothetical protein